jgi:hypothetical protein
VIRHAVLVLIPVAGCGGAEMPEPAPEVVRCPERHGAEAEPLVTMGLTQPQTDSEEPGPIELEVELHRSGRLAVLLLGPVGRGTLRVDAIDAPVPTGEHDQVIDPPRDRANVFVVVASDCPIDGSPLAAVLASVRRGEPIAREAIEAELSAPRGTWAPAGGGRNAGTCRPDEAGVCLGQFAIFAVMMED